MTALLAIIAAVMILLQLLAVAAIAAMRPEVGRERPTPIDSRAERYTEAYLTLGSYMANHGNASARPDGSGTAQVLTQLAIRDHAPGDQMNFLADLAFLSDRKRALSRPVSFDYYLALTRRGEDGRFVQVGRDEALPLDGPGRSNKYWDLRAGKIWKPGAFGLFAGWYFKNDGRNARPDLSGEAFLRYSLFIQAPVGGPVRLRVDGDFLTDERSRRYRPASLDLSVAGILNWERCEVGVAYKPWITLDRRSVSEVWMLTFGYHFDGRDIYNSTPGSGI